MPMRMTPKPEAVIPTKKVAPTEFTGTGPYEEWFDILEFTRPEVIRDARTNAIRVTKVGGKTKEEFDQQLFSRYLVDRNCKGFNIMLPPGEEKKYEATRYEVREIPDEKGVKQKSYWWLYTDENVAELPWDIIDWMANQIVGSGGTVPTRDLVTEGPYGRPLSFRSEDDRMGDADGSGVPDTK